MFLKILKVNNLLPNKTKPSNEGFCKIKTMNKETKVFIGILKELAQQRGLTNYAIAQRTGVTEPTISRYFNFKSVPPLDNFVAIAKAVGVACFFQATDHTIDLKTAFKNASKQASESENDLFTFQESDKLNHYIAVHKKANIIVEFERGKFNESQKVTNLVDFHPSEYGKIPTYIRQLGDWLVENHSELL